MKEKTFLPTLIIISGILIIVSCSLACPDRLLEITVPDHPWESVSGKALWYTLKWTYGDEIRSLYLGPGERQASIHVPTGNTVLLYRLRDFPDGPVVKSMPCSAGVTGSLPGQGTKIPHAKEQLRPRAASAAPSDLN